jgi:PIN domain nuclease of toxin-antitoxin system
LRLLLDTHILLWAVTDSPRLPRPARALLEDESNTLIASAATIWEVAIKHAKGGGGPNAMPMSGNDLLLHLEAHNVELLPILPAHAAEIDKLPIINRDPFDRMLVAQALYEQLRLLTHDQALAAYGDFVRIV